MNEPIDELIKEMHLDLTVDPSGNTAILTYRHKDRVELADLEPTDISDQYPLPRNLSHLFTKSVSEERIGEDETAAFVERLIDWDYIPTSPSELGEQAYGKYYTANRQQINAQLTYFRRMRKLAKELRAALGETDFGRIANADYGDMSD
jgi:hypothetical protein